MPGDSLLDIPRELLILGAAVESGMIKALSEKAMEDWELALKLGANTRAVWVMCEALYALGYLQRWEGKWQLSDAAKDMLYNPNSKNYTGFSFMHKYYMMASWLTLPEVIRTGIPKPKEKKPEKLEYFMAAMSNSARKSAQEIAAHCLLGMSGEPEVIDIGGGPLTYARAFAARGARVTVFDLPEVIEYAFSQLGESEKINLVAGDFNEWLPPGPFDLAFLGNVCHIYGERENKLLFKRVAGILKPKGKIAIFDFVRGKSPEAAVFAVNMLVNTASGGTWTYDQYEGWLKCAGFAEIKITAAAGRHVITAALKVS